MKIIVYPKDMGREVLYFPLNDFTFMIATMQMGNKDKDPFFTKDDLEMLESCGFRLEIADLDEAPTTETKE